MSATRITTLTEYEDKTFPQAYYPGIGSNEGVNYCIVALAGEAGENCNKWKKALRDEKIDICGDSFTCTRPVDPAVTKRKAEIIDEMGDCLWYITALAREFGIGLEELANLNYAKIKKRHKVYNQLG